MTSYFGFARSTKERRGLPINNVTLTLVQLYDVSKYDAHTPSAKERKKELSAKVWPANLCHWNLSSLVDTSMGCKNKVRTDLNLILLRIQLYEVKRHTEKMARSVRSIPVCF